MNYKIVKINELSGRKTTIYSVLIEGDNKTLFEKFIQENLELYRNEIEDILLRTKAIGEKFGAREQFFKHNEGKPGDLVCALYDNPEKKLRCYCIRYSQLILIMGAGGLKTTRTWQEDSRLSHEVKRIIQISQDIYKKQLSGDIQISEDGLFMIGNLDFEGNEQ
ncbi:MAG TPA: hypothetical protein VNB90_06465 [Cytophagaceae bacterium]|nr:hypothetical protein [Cytophagaceae bacterium]